MKYEMEIDCTIAAVHDVLSDLIQIAGEIDLETLRAQLDLASMSLACVEALLLAARRQGGEAPCRDTRAHT